MKYNSWHIVYIHCYIHTNEDWLYRRIWYDDLECNNYYRSKTNHMHGVRAARLYTHNGYLSHTSTDSGLGTNTSVEWRCAWPQFDLCTWLLKDHDLKTKCNGKKDCNHSNCWPGSTSWSNAAWIIYSNKKNKHSWNVLHIAISNGWYFCVPGSHVLSVGCAVVVVVSVVVFSTFPVGGLARMMDYIDLFVMNTTCTNNMTVALHANLNKFRKQQS